MKGRGNIDIIKNLICSWNDHTQSYHFESSFTFISKYDSIYKWSFLSSHNNSIVMVKWNEIFLLTILSSQQYLSQMQRAKEEKNSGRKRRTCIEWHNALQTNNNWSGFGFISPDIQHTQQSKRIECTTIPTYWASNVELEREWERERWMIRKREMWVRR